MNYPFRNAALALLRDRDGETFYNILTELYASYPRASCNVLMNIIGTHDTERILTVLGDEARGEGLTNAELAHLRLSDEKRKKAIRLLKLASALQFTVFGIPSIYYGAEAGVEGHHDPFCRMPYPWGREDGELFEHYRALGKLRREHPSLKDGEFRFVTAERELIAYERVCENDRLLVLVNIGSTRVYTLSGKWRNALTKEAVGKTVTVPSDGFLILNQ
jgi:glycosidase